MNILNLPDWEVIEANESEYDYAIHAKYLKEPEACLKCGVVGELYRHGVKKQRFMDLPVHNKRVGLIVHRQRYHCRACKKTSFQPLPDMNKQHAVSNRLLDFNPQAKCPRWEQFLNEVFGDTELIDWLWRALGYSISGDTTEQVVFIGHGIDQWKR